MRRDENELEALVDSPSESLDVELKCWLDLDDRDAQANLAQALLALANHGGGFVVLGFSRCSDGETTSCGDVPREMLGSYNQDNINSIVKRYADPPFHCELLWVRRRDGVRHAVVCVPGGHTVPIRALRGGPDNSHVKQDVYYIRRPGPESAPPRSGDEWNRLIRGCVAAAKNELSDIIRSALVGGSPASESRVPVLHAWQAECMQAFREAVRERLPNEAPSRYDCGYWTFAYVLHGQQAVPLPALHRALRRAKVRVTTWPAWVVLDNNPVFRPVPRDTHHIECLVAAQGDERDAAHSDYWRVSDDGKAFLLRGYGEDAVDNLPPKTALDQGLLVCRTAECFLHAGSLAAELGSDATRASAHVHWTGLAGRKLGDYFGEWPEPPSGPSATANDAIVKAEFEPASVRAALGRLVTKTLEPLFALFGFARPDPIEVEGHLSRMLKSAS
jgi:hypothetical protein